VGIESKKTHQSNCENGDIVTFTQAKKYEPHLHKVTFLVKSFIEHMFLLYTIYEYALFKGTMLTLMIMYTHKNVILHHSTSNENNIALLLSKICTPNENNVALLLSKICTPNENNIALLLSKICTPNENNIALLLSKICTHNSGGHHKRNCKQRERERERERERFNFFDFLCLIQ
jgi:hypothetical protein